MREGKLSSNNHAFLHGSPTTVCGSWLNNKCQCGNGSCDEVSSRIPSAAWDEILKQEENCSICIDARHSRQRVARGSDDPRFYAEKFVDAPGIFPKNDIKYDVNKKRAQQFAATHKEGITWVQAKDTITTAALQEKPDLPLHKLSWLSRHDRECGDLYGMFPLIHNLPVALTDHIDRNPDKQLLRGRIGRIHSWKLSPTETSQRTEDIRILQELPEVVFVKFEGCQWHIKGTPEPGIYPIKPVKRSCFLDKGRQRPKLEIKRFQLPLAPAFSWTAHMAQGQTLQAAIVDLQLGSGTNPMTSYVAFTRVKHRNALLIFRPFDRDVFTHGNLEGP